MGTSPLPACPPKGQERLLASAWGREPLAEHPHALAAGRLRGQPLLPSIWEWGHPRQALGGVRLGAPQTGSEGRSEQERGEQALFGARPRVAAHLSGPDRLPSFCLPS